MNASLPTWPKHLSVDKKIILLLSASTYENFPRALRELVSNAYDADATRLEIRISDEHSVIEIKDNGSGMTPSEFEFFLRIAGNNQERSRTTPLGRKRIGQFGIGFLAMFPFCESVEIESTIDGSPIVFRASLPASKYLSSKTKQVDLTEVDVDGIEFSDEKKKEEHYTQIKLLNTTDLLSRYLTSHKNIRSSRNSIKSWPGMKRLIWELQDVLPIRLKKTSPVNQYTDSKPRNFEVYLNGKNLVGNCSVTEVLEHSEGLEKVGNIRFTYAIGTPWEAVIPNEARGLRVRLNHVGVGNRQIFDLGTHGRAFSRLTWLTGEINILSGLDEAITLDRDSFTASQDYDSFYEFFRTKLRNLAYYVEDVDVAKRKIKEKFTNSARAETASKSEVIRKQVSNLEKRGFTVIENSTPSGTPVEINTKNKTVKISFDKKHFKDHITVAGKLWEVSYSSWDTVDSKYKACLISDDDKLQINKNYPLFSGTHKDVFRRVQIIITQAESESSSKEIFFERLQELMLLEFDG